LQADFAITRFNLSRCLPDPSGEQQRALVVRRANARKAPASDLQAAIAAQVGCARPSVDGSLSRPWRPQPPAHAPG
jgi:hypothetical protein